MTALLNAGERFGQLECIEEVALDRYRCAVSGAGMTAHSRPSMRS
jgi:hypothetical protein